MKKKIIVLVSVVLLVGVAGFSSAFALENNSTDSRSIFKSMFDSMKSWVQQAEDKGEITKDQADSWDDHINDMQKYHEQNGSGACGGLNNNKADDGNAGDSANGAGQSYTPRYNGGMMGNGYGSGMMGL